MPKQHTTEIFVAMNEDGDTYIQGNPDDLLATAQGEIGGEVFRIVKVNLTMTAPETTEINMTAPEEAGEESATVG